MSEVPKKELNLDSLEVTELEDDQLEDVAGGVLDPNVGCNSCPNVNCPCSPKEAF